MVVQVIDVVRLDLKFGVANGRPVNFSGRSLYCPEYSSWLWMMISALPVRHRIARLLR